MPTAPYKGALKLAEITEKTQALMGYGRPKKLLNKITKIINKDK